jgi:hypothetical protein
LRVGNRPPAPMVGMKAPEDPLNNNDIW